MQDDFPVPIFSEKDLEIYDKYISKETASKGLSQYLTCHIGKDVKIEALISNRIEVKTGVLMEVGKDYLVLKLPKCQSVIIEGSCIKFITVMHGGKRYK